MGGIRYWARSSVNLGYKQRSWFSRDSYTIRQSQRAVILALDFQWFGRPDCLRQQYNPFEGVIFGIIAWLGSECRNIYLSPEYDADTNCDVDEIRDLLDQKVEEDQIQ